jgi:hypothetical protein
MIHSEGLTCVQTSLAYVEQQRAVSAALRAWRDLAAMQKVEAQKRIPITNVVNK